MTTRKFHSYANPELVRRVELQRAIRRFRAAARALQLKNGQPVTNPR